ncbi:collagen alpha-1(III) chain-like isoform X2 [Motacilla alba alba]|uniref:collagen alpha-1(III) chain-like isoform X2 n=1 Tax=Motacilla alba alba TaxID=1094192 RepID=UPI0018D58F18|nr:collagen alpha-1(III) chain-like isoform X2 [Motacilla alba alba]
MPGGIRGLRRAPEPGWARGRPPKGGRDPPGPPLGPARGLWRARGGGTAGAGVGAGICYGNPLAWKERQEMSGRGGHGRAARRAPDTGRGGGNGGSPRAPPQRQPRDAAGSTGGMRGRTPTSPRSSPIPAQERERSLGKTPDPRNPTWSCRGLGFPAWAPGKGSSGFGGPGPLPAHPRGTLGMWHGISCRAREAPRNLPETSSSSRLGTSGPPGPASPGRRK